MKIEKIYEGSSKPIKVFLLVVLMCLVATICAGVIFIIGEIVVLIASVHQMLPVAIFFIIVVIVLALFIVYKPYNKD